MMMVFIEIFHLLVSLSKGVPVTSGAQAALLLRSNWSDSDSDWDLGSLTLRADTEKATVQTPSH